MNRIVADDQTIINPMGVRWVEKNERMVTHTSGCGSVGMRYGLKVAYKGDTHYFEYLDKSSRDAQFDRLVAVMTFVRQPAS